MNSTDIVPSTAEAPPTPLSKNAQKRLQKEEQYLLKRAFRKQQDKEKRELKKRKMGTHGDHQVQQVQQPLLSEEEKALAVEARRIKKETAKTDFDNKCKSSFSVIIDCSWENDHNEKSLKSLSQQIGFTYGYNRNSPNPCDLHVTNVGPLLAHKLQKNNSETWWSVNILRGRDFVDLEQFVVNNDNNNYTSIVSSYFNGGLDRKKELIYLTSDATETLTTLSHDCAYIIGGIVDRNRLRNITYQKAVALGIRTAKLPIRENIDLKSTHVLTVNHVFEILLNFQEENDWKKAIEKVIPPRKEANRKEEDEEKNSGGGGDDDNDSENS